MDITSPDKSNIVVAIPCLNEESTIGKVIDDFGRALPGARIVVFDNNSVDNTAAVAEGKNVAVVRVKKPGKGSVVQEIFEKVSEDIVILVDGDDTYPASQAKELIQPLLEFRADMVVGVRLDRHQNNGMRRLNKIGNYLLTTLLNFCFGTQFRDILSGYRAFNRNFIDHIPLLTRGFETETEMTIQALEHGMIIREIPISYKERPDGSRSKLRAFKDGYRILITIAMLLRDHRPLASFSYLALGLLLAGSAVYLLIPPTFGTVLALVFLLLSLLMGTVGLVLNAVNTRFRELHTLLRKR